MEPRLLPLALPTPLRNFLRPGRASARSLQDMISGGRSPCDGVVIDSTLLSHERGLLEAANASDIQTILDPRSLELASIGGRVRTGVSDLPWAMSDVHSRSSFASMGTRRFVAAQIARFADQYRFSAVLAPTHLIETADDPWLDIDDALTNQLRIELDALGLDSVAIHRPLYLSSAVISGKDRGRFLSRRLGWAGSDSIWIAVHPFGTSNSGPLSLRRYFDFCRHMHETRIPLIGMHTGTVGLTVMALGAVSGIESGMTDGEGFDVSRHVLAPKELPAGVRPMGSTPGIYIEGLAVFLTTREAMAFYSVKGMTSAHGCRGECCRRGVRDMLENRLPHFATTRRREVDELSRIPSHQRARSWLDDKLRPASDSAIQAARAHPRMHKARRQIDDWRVTVAGIIDTVDLTTSSSPPLSMNRRGSSRRASGQGSRK
jgi:hypothetical protein